MMRITPAYTSETGRRMNRASGGFSLGFSVSPFSALQLHRPFAGDLAEWSKQDARYLQPEVTLPIAELSDRQSGLPGV